MPRAWLSSRVARNTLTSSIKTKEKERTRQVSQRILNPVGHLAGCLFGVVFYKDSSTSFQSISPMPFSSSSTARAMILRLSALKGSM